VTDERALTDQLLGLGVPAGGVLVVHTAFSRVAPVLGGPSALIGALRHALGPAGTLVMPSMSDDDETAFDRRLTPCRAMGIVADTFWRMPDVERSDSPHAFAAAGAHALEITAPHPLEIPHGLNSPVGRAYELDASVLLLGVGHSENTTIHLAENLAGVGYGRSYCSTLLEGGATVRREYFEVGCCCAKFELMDAWLEAEDRQRRGQVGMASARLARARDIVAAALPRLQEHETLFLHAAASCEECDEARTALARRSDV
jgi:aminoglycoside N3'-acetyltransferase